MGYTGTIAADAIASAIESEEFVLYYQPQSDLTSGKIIGLEALVRWHSKTLGQVDTSHLIGILENSEIKLIAKFHEWAIRTAFKQIVAWREIGISVPVELNFSARYLQEIECLTLITNLLQEYDLPISCIGIGVTKSYPITNMSTARFVLQKLSKMGIRITLEGFGAGYCSLECLGELPVNIIKLDKRFIHCAIEESAQYKSSNAVILELLITLATKLGIEVHAAGVDTIKQLELVTLLGFDAYQGYFFCPPAPANLVTDLILKELNRQNSNSHLCQPSFVLKRFLNNTNLCVENDKS